MGFLKTVRCPNCNHTLPEHDRMETEVEADELSEYCYCEKCEKYFHVIYHFKYSHTNPLIKW